MKKFLMIFSFIISIALITEAKGGGSFVGNGGDEISREFVAIGKMWLSLSESRFGTFLTKSQLEKFRSAISETKVESTYHILLGLDGLPKDAINQPENKLIMVHKTSWHLITSFENKAFLVLHEYFGIAGIGDHSYELTSGLPLVLNSVDLIQFNKFARELISQAERYSALTFKMPSIVFESQDPEVKKLNQYFAVVRVYFNSMQEAISRELEKNHDSRLYEFASMIQFVNHGFAMFEGSDVKTFRSYEQFQDSIGMLKYYLILKDPVYPALR